MSKKSPAAIRRQQSAIQPITPGARMLNVRQAAAYLGCTVWFMRNLTWKKEIPYVPMGARYLYDKADLDAYVDKNKAAA